MSDQSISNAHVSVGAKRSRAIARAILAFNETIRELPDDMGREVSGPRGLSQFPECDVAFHYVSDPNGVDLVTVFDLATKKEYSLSESGLVLTEAK